MEQQQFDRSALVELLKIPLKTQTPEDRAVYVREQVDRKLAALFGARLFLSYDLCNLFSKPTFSLDKIAGKLSVHNIGVPAQVLVADRLLVDKFSVDYYKFEKVVTPQGDELYRLVYHRGFRAGAE